MPLGRDDAKKTIERVLALRKDGDLEVELLAQTSSHTRFARNEITTSGLVEDVTLSIVSRREGRSGAVSTNDLSDAGLREAVARATALRDLMPVDPEWVDTLPLQTYPSLQKYDARAEQARAAERASGVKATLALAERRKLTAAGFFQNEAEWRSIGNSKGNFAHHASTDVEFSVTMRTADGTGSGWASSYSPRFSEVDPKAVARRAGDKGLLSARPREVPPGDYTVILEPEAVAALVQTLQFGPLSKRAADEGRSVFSKEGGGSRVGEKVVHDSITLTTDPFEARVPALPWSAAAPFGGGTSGLPNRKVVWIEKGSLKTLHADRYWAGKTDVAPTPFPASLVLEGGRATIDELVASTDRGLLVTRFWYIRSVNPQTWQLTGLTRDGLFLIEKG